MKILKDSHAYNILKYIMISVEFPYQSLYLVPGPDRMIKRNVRQLREEGYITVTGSAEMKTIRLTKKVFPIIEDRFGKEYLDAYLERSKGHHFRGGESGQRQTWRQHRMGEIEAIMYKSEFKTWLFEKPELILGSLRNKPLDLSIPLYYDSKEIKSIDEEQSKKTSFTRIIGLLMSTGGHYCVYNVNQGLIKWSNQGEQKAQILVQDIIRSNYNRGGTNYKADSAIMYGKDMDVALEILESNGSNKDNNGYELLSFDNTFRNIHFLTIDPIGIAQTRMITSRRWKEKLAESLFGKENLVGSRSSIDCDAIAVVGGEKMNMLSFLDGNIGRLKRFKQAKDLKISDNIFTVFCFPHQEQMVKAYMGDNKTKVITVKEEDIFKIMDIDKEVKK